MFVADNAVQDMPGVGMLPEVRFRHGNTPSGLRPPKLVLRRRRGWDSAVSASPRLDSATRCRCCLFVASADFAPIESHCQEAERVGFEPTRRTRRLPVFETGPFNRSGTSPIPVRLQTYSIVGCVGSFVGVRKVHLLASFLAASLSV